MKKYKSITTPDIQHDAPNALTELILLNKDIKTPEYPWKTDSKKFWIKTVACLRKLMKQFNISEDQLAFYIFKCAPQSIDQKEFAKAAVLAKQILREEDLSNLMDIYRSRKRKVDENSTVGINMFAKPRKTLMQLLKELEEDG